MNICTQSLIKARSVQDGFKAEAVVMVTSAATCQNPPTVNENVVGSVAHGVHTTVAAESGHADVPEHNAHTSEHVSEQAIDMQSGA